ncbi:MAG: hypothetical protein ACOYBM_03190 [Dethiobacteria bacterium]|jgi:hypothetical protein|nr:hypothetical protein [Bacillota bacterium]
MTALYSPGEQFLWLGATGKASDGTTPLNGADSEKVRVGKGIRGAIFVDRATGVEAQQGILHFLSKV